MDYDDILTEDFDGIAEAFKNTLFKEPEKECTHPDIKAFLDGRGYCYVCGIVFQDASDPLSQCTHKNVVKDDNNGVNVCRTCGKELPSLDFSQEWRYFGSSDNRSSQDPSRCRKPKATQNSIKTYFQNRTEHFHHAIIDRVEARYNKVVERTSDKDEIENEKTLKREDIKKEKLLRGKGREALIAVCLFYSYQDDYQYRTLKYIKKMFKVKQQDISQALTRYFIAFPEDKLKHMTPQKLLRWVMEKTKTDIKHYRRIMLVSEYFTATSQLIERSNPQSVAAATIYFYLHYFPDYTKGSEVNKVKFAREAGLSDITVIKIFKEMKRIADLATIDYQEENK